MKLKSTTKTFTQSLILSVAILVTTTALADNNRILTYGDSNTWGWSPIAKGFPAKRQTDDVRWSGILEKALGNNSKVIVDGLVGRTTNLANGSDVGRVTSADFNGQLSLPESIARNAPLDLVIIMLGTNDLQTGKDRSPEAIAKAAFDLGKLAQSIAQPTFSAYDAPKVLVIAPPAYGDTSKTPLAGLFATGEKPS